MEKRYETRSGDLFGRSWADTYVCAFNQGQTEDCARFLPLFKGSLMLSERTFVLRETVKRVRLVCFSNCFFSGNAYSVNIVRQF